MLSAPQSELYCCARAQLQYSRSSGSMHSWMIPEADISGAPYFKGQCTLCRLFQHNLEGIMPHILDPKQLKEDVKRLHAAHCGSEPPADIMLEESPSSNASQDLERWECQDCAICKGHSCCMTYVMNKLQLRSERCQERMQGLGQQSALLH